MTVYADILILINFIVDYFLILLSSKFLHIKPKFSRLILGAALGGLFSLYIFLPHTNFFLQMLSNIFMSAVLCMVTFGYKDIKFFLRNVTTLFAVNFAYSGAMIALWLVFEPYGMIINNSVIYFNISPTFLIIFSVVGYFAVILIKKFSKRPFLQNTYCEATLFCLDKKITLSGIIDTGNSLQDAFGLSKIFITEHSVIDMLLDKEKQNTTRFRKIPCGTITGESLLDGYRIDKIKILFGNKKYEFKNPVLAVSQTPLADAKLIINPENLN